MLAIDLNADIGEDCGNDKAIMSFISSANICCGAHAGSNVTTVSTIALAKQHKIAIGAHPGYPDKSNFGRFELNLSAAEIVETLDQQLNQFQQQCHALDTDFGHIKFHGALYHRANNDIQLAKAVCQYLQQTWASKTLVIQAATPIVDIAQQFDLRVNREGFIDRRYRSANQLISRQLPDAVIDEPRHQLCQFQQLLSGAITTQQDGTVAISVDTLCLHGDSDNAFETAKSIHLYCDQQGIVVRSMS